MSDMERNQGTLTPYHGKVTDDMHNEPENYELIKIHDKLYRPNFTVKSEKDANGFAYVSINTVGNIAFHTYHYNGGGSLEEVIEAALERTNHV